MSNLKAFKLLYAEDDDTIRAGYVQYFKTIFEYVYEAVDGKEAYKLYQEHQPDILILDINMPYINGLELVEKIRSHNTDIKIIILTAHTDTEKLLQAIPLGLTHYLQKPVQKRLLQDIIFKIITSLEQGNLNLLYFSDTMYYDKQSNILLENGNEIHLTRNEKILLNFLASKRKTEYSIEDIINEFWHTTSEKDMSQDSIRNIIKRLKPKLPADAIKNNYGLGYKLNLK